MNYNSLMNKPTINYRELIGDNSVTEVGGITEEQFNTLLTTDLSSYYTKAEIDDLFSRSYVYREKSGSIVTFDCPASVNGINKVVSEIVAVQSGTGDPSPTNVRPISGWSAVNVTDASENLFNGVYPNIDSTTRKLTLDVGEGSFTMVSTIPVFNNGLQNIANIFLQTGTGEETASSDLDGVWKGHPITVNSTDGKVTIKYRIFENRAVCDPRRYETWLARSITTYTTTLKDGQGNPMTCYGGQLTNENGVQRLDNRKVIVDMGDLNWTYGNGFFRTTDLNATIKRPANNNTKANVISSMYTVETWNAITNTDNGKFALSAGATDPLLVCNTTYTDATAFKTAMAGQKIVYELATPQQIPQDSLSIATQDGTNNLWADSGDIQSGEYMEAL